MKARYLRRATLEELREAVPDNLELYRAGSFPPLLVDYSKFFEIGFEIHDTKLAELRPPDGGDQLFEEHNCIVCYAALPDLSPYEARDERFWAYLTHTLMLNYARQRWPIPADDTVAVDHIRAHFFAKEKRQVERDNAASRLWWMAYLCQRVTHLSLQEALEVLLHRSDVRANIIERPTASQSTVVFSSILRKLHSSYQGERKLFERSIFRRLMIGINSIGGVKLLDCLTEPQMLELIDQVVEQDLQLSLV